MNIYQLRIKVKKTDESASIPKYAHKGDSGFDLASTETVTISPGETKLISTGLSFGIPVGYEMQIRPRSGMSAKTKFRVANAPGTIDSNYTGEVKIIAENIGHRAIFIEKGDRIAQGVICPVYEAVFVEQDLEDTNRGNNGFGSSGSN
jgi:dUTP pyrophosphatase